jgi:hypothetical protein
VQHHEHRGGDIEREVSRQPGQGLDAARRGPYDDDALWSRDFFHRTSSGHHDPHRAWVITMTGASCCIISVSPFDTQIMNLYSHVRQLTRKFMAGWRIWIKPLK